MNRLLVGYICILIIISTFCCSGPYRTEKDRDETIYIGKVDRSLFEESELSWFKEEYQRYKPQSKVLDSIRGGNDSLYVIVFLGNWCGDTYRELPRFQKIIETEKIPLRILEYHAVNRKKESGEILPVAFGIRLVPTFVFIRNGKEIGRIVEAPEKSLEEDIVDMFAKAK
jgi:thiol-disulfide isomerase/thioredoxin